MTRKSFARIFSVSFLFAFLSALGPVQAGPLELASPNEDVDGAFGWYVSGVPDLTGDGRGDVIVGARSDNPGGSPTDAGRAYVYDGATGALLAGLVLDPTEEQLSTAFWPMMGAGVWGAAVVSGVDNFLRPWLIARGSDLPFLLVFMGVIGGVLTFGILGIFLGPTLLAVASALLREWLTYDRRKLDEDDAGDEADG